MLISSSINRAYIDGNTKKKKKKEIRKYKDLAVFGKIEMGYFVSTHWDSLETVNTASNKLKNKLAY